MESKSQCPQCGRDVPSDARFCPTCGSNLREQRMVTGMLTTQSLLHNRYAISRKLAQGGQSAVYLALDTAEGGAERAVKEMSEANLGVEERNKAINDFMREAHMLDKLSHPSLAKVYEMFVEGHKYYLVMEYVPGHNLEDEMVVFKKEPLEWEPVVRWGIQLCDVLTYLHAQHPPIIYRDLKPANVMLTPQGEIKLIDFGIARWLYPHRMNDTMQLGTDGYAPLEQYSAQSEPRSDLYALGASLYHLLTGRVPESAPLRMAGRTLTTIRAINKRVPEPVERVIQQALNLHTSDRFIDAGKMREALEWAYRQSAPLPGLAAQNRSTFGPAQPGRPIASVASGGPLVQEATVPTSAVPPFGPVHAGGGSSARRNTATPAVVAPRLYIWPLRLDAGNVAVNQNITLELEVANRGGGQLSGHTETNIACLSVEPALVDPATSNLQVRIDTANLPVGPYVCHVAVRTNGGDQIVQVRFVVRPPGDMLVGRSRLTGQ